MIDQVGKRPEHRIGSTVGLHKNLSQLGLALESGDVLEAHRLWAALSNDINRRLPLEGKRCSALLRRCPDCGTPYRFSNNPQICPGLEATCSCGHKYNDRFTGQQKTYPEHLEKQERFCPVCAAQRKLCGGMRRTCRNRAMANGRCPNHNGRKAAPVYHKNARGNGTFHLKLARQNLVEWYESSLGMSTDKALSLRREIALADVRITEMLEEAERVHQVAPRIEVMVANANAALKLLREAELDQSLLLLESIYKDLQRLSSYDGIWNGIRLWVETQMRLKKTERENMTRAQAMMAFEQVVEIIRYLQQAFVFSVETHVGDEKTRALLMQEHSVLVRSLVGDDPDRLSEQLETVEGEFVIHEDDPA